MGQKANEAQCDSERRAEPGGAELGLPPLSPTPVPLCVMDITMGTDQLEHKVNAN